VLYPTELRGHNRVVNFVYLLLDSVIIFTKLMRTRLITVLLIGIGFLSTCVASNPLTISLYNSKTNTLRKCAARESTPKNTQILASIVEACARQLEAHGFVRVDESFVPPSSAGRNTPALTGQSSR
jgi:hypothetical protein